MSWTLIAKVKIIGVIEYFKINPKFWNIQQMKGVITHFPSVQSHIGHMMCPSALCVVVMLNNEFQIRFKDFEPAKFTLSFIINLCEERMDGSENDKFIFSVFKKNVCELDIETSNSHLDLSLKTWVVT
jgi:hypothetical protein